MSRLPITKTPKCFVGGSFIRSESGRVYEHKDSAGAFVCNIPLCTRKDLRNAVEAAAKAAPGWAKRSAYNRGQILYRIAEMLESRADELAAALANLQQRYLPRLNHARRHGLVQAGCLHHEGDGIIAIDQGGQGGSLRETRLYAYPHDASFTLHLLLIADKSTQKRDLRLVYELLDHLRTDPSHG